MRINRVWVVTALVLLASAFYELRLRPQSRPIYERARSSYNRGNYAASLQDLERAYQIEPNSTAILVMMGWNHLKLGQYDKARENFSRAARLDSDLVEAKLGLVFVSLEMGEGESQLA